MHRKSADIVLTLKIICMEREEDNVQEYLDKIKPKTKRPPYIWPTWILVVWLLVDLVKYYVTHNSVSNVIAILSIIVIVAFGVVCCLLVKHYRLFRYVYIIIILYVLWSIYVICKFNFSFPI